MSKKNTILISLAATAAASLLTFQITALTLGARYKRELDLQQSSDLAVLGDKLKLVEQYYNDYYIGEWDQEESEKAVLNAFIASTGDRYGYYFSAEEYEAFLSDINGEMQGIGVLVVYNQEQELPEIAAVMPDSPALEADVRVGDLLVEVNGESCTELGYTESVNAMIGKSGTTAVFTVARGDDYAERVEKTVTRREVTSLTVLSHMYEEDGLKLGVLKLLEFNGATPKQFESAVNTLLAQGAQGLIMDVRNNPGGELQSVLNILDSLVPEGILIRITDASGEETTYSSDARELNTPMAVLVNGQSASAAELFSGTLRDYGKAFLVGTQTYGKGSMQTSMTLPDQSAIKFTYRKYSPPITENYDGVGLTPDVVVELSEEASQKSLYAIADQEDNQLMAAVEKLREQIVQ